MVASVWGDGTPKEAFEIPPDTIINEQVGNYLILNTDAHRIIDYIGAGTGGANQFTLPSTVEVGAGWTCFIRNSGTGTLTILTGTGGDTVDSAASITLTVDQTLQLMVKGTDFGVLLGRNIGATATGTAFTPAGNLAATNVQAAIQELDTEKAKLAGDAAQTFLVANATAGSQMAVPMAQAEASFPSATGLISQMHTYFTTTGGAGVYALNPTQVQTAYAAGQRFSVKFNAVGAVGGNTISVNGLAAKSIKKYDSSGAKVITTNTDIYASMLSDIIYDGVDFVLLDPAPAALLNIIPATFSATGTWTKPTGLSASALVIVEVWGGGGGGGALGSFAGAGGGGAYNRKAFLASALGATEPVTVATAAAISVAGGTSSFGAAATLVQAFGGGAGSLYSGVNGGSGGGGGGILAVGANGGTGSGGDGAAGGAGGTGITTVTAGGAGGGKQGVSPGPVAGFWGGGGGSGTEGAGAASVFGGGGGGSGTTAGGVSINGGAGGADGVAGVAPGGGGGNNAVGGAGMVRVSYHG